MKSKYLIFLVLTLILSSFYANAQQAITKNFSQKDTIQKKLKDSTLVLNKDKQIQVDSDSLVIHKIISPRLDSTYLNKDIFKILPTVFQGYRYSVSVKQNPNILKAFNNYIKSNNERDLWGYRIRIFFDNKQNARALSEQVINEFDKLYPAVPSYRTYQAPFFKISVGDYRTKSEALAALKILKEKFPNSFILREKIEYPSLSDDFNVTR